MKDLITYCANIASLRQELIHYGQVNENGDAVLNINKTPVMYSKSGVQTLSLVRCLTPEVSEKLGRLKNLELLGTYDEVFADPAKMSKYTSVYSLEPITSSDPQSGETVTYTPPKKFGVFA